MSFETIFDASYERVLNTNLSGQSFFDAFYENFTQASPEVKGKFKNVDMERQKRMLKKSFYHLIVFYATNNVDDYLKKTARSHDRNHLDIHPKLYDLWLDILIKTVESYDPEFNQDIELAWRLVLSTGITYMKFKYIPPSSQHPDTE